MLELHCSDLSQRPNLAETAGGCRGALSKRSESDRDVDDLTGDVAIQGFVPAAIVSVACVCLMYRLLLQPQAASLESAALQQEVTALRELQIEVAATLQQQLKLLQRSSRRFWLSLLLLLTASASHCISTSHCVCLSLCLHLHPTAPASHCYCFSATAKLARLFLLIAGRPMCLQRVFRLWLSTSSTAAWLLRARWPTPVSGIGTHSE